MTILTAYRRMLPLTAVVCLMGSEISTTGFVSAQEPLPQGELGPNEEPSSRSELLDRTDFGNVVQTARMHYNAGLRYLAQAEKQQGKLSQIDDPKRREVSVSKVEKLLAKADEAFREALSFDADLVDAYAGLGRTLRLQGKDEEALQVYAAAVRLAPEDLETFTGWAESLLALDMLGNATSAYSEYSRSNPARAEVLMAAIKRWLAQRQIDPGSLDPSDVERMANWIEQQSSASSG